MATVGFNTHFPGYEILGELGRSNARVLKARHLATGDLVAIKHFSLNTDADTLRRFQRESAIMSDIDHPNIVKIREVRIDAEWPYIVMELIEGGSLRQLLGGCEKLDVPTVTRLGLQLLSAFSAFHPKGIVHRDIKPENILYRPLPSGELHFLLTDFGVARLHEQSQTLTGQSMMTYEYASPEQFNDPRQVGVATDYYSLGVVLFECLSGGVPFPVGDQAGIVTFMNSVMHDTPPPFPVTPGGRSLTQFGELLDGLLEKNAQDRISDPDDLAWLLKRAELDYLRTDKVSLPARKNGTLSAAGTALARNRLNEVDTPNEPVVLRKPGRELSTLVAKVLTSIVFIAIGGLAIYYFVGAAEGVMPIGQAASGQPVAGDSIPAQLPLIDSTRLKQADENRRQEQRHQRTQAAIRMLSASMTDYRVGLIGGIKGAVLQLNNPGDIAFTSVQVKVNYYKEKGGLFKSETVKFIDVGPHSSPVRNAPDSDRGTRLSCNVVSYTLPDSLLEAGVTGAGPDSAGAARFNNP